MVVYTDGVREARDQNGNEYGHDRLKAVIKRAHGNGSTALLDEILKDLETFRGGAAVVDDISVVVIRPG